MDGESGSSARVEPVDILVVDDDPWIAELVVMAAEERGWTVCTAANGPDGLALLAEARPRVMLLDVRLPKQDGWSTLAELEARQPDHPPVIMMTANQMEEDEGRHHSAVAVLRKPFPMQVFFDLLARYLA